MGDLTTTDSIGGSRMGAYAYGRKPSKLPAAYSKGLPRPSGKKKAAKRSTKGA